MGRPFFTLMVREREAEQAPRCTSVIYWRISRVFTQHNGTESITAPTLSQWEHVCCYCLILERAVILLPGPLPLCPLYKHTHMRVRTLPPYGAHARTGSVPIQSFEEPPPQKGRLDISRSNNLSQALRVALVSPSALRTRWLI